MTKLKVLFVPVYYSVYRATCAESTGKWIYSCILPYLLWHINQDSHLKASIYSLNMLAFTWGACSWEYGIFLFLGWVRHSGGQHNETCNANGNESNALHAAPLPRQIPSGKYRIRSCTRSYRIHLCIHIGSYRTRSYLPLTTIFPKPGTHFMRVRYIP